jgi:hypothetical protein
MTMLRKMQITDETGADLLLENGAIPVSVQDQHSIPLLRQFCHVIASTMLNDTVAVDDTTFTVADSTGMVVGHYIQIIDTMQSRVYAGTILAISSNDITVDSPLDIAYTDGSEVVSGVTNMAVDGSTTPVTFSYRLGSQEVDNSYDITRVTMICTTSTAVDLSKFGDQTALTKGFVFRKVDTENCNIANIKTNADLALTSGVWQPHSASNPAQGVDGFFSMMTFAGQANIGVAVRVASDENLEFIIQDDLSGLVSLHAMGEGHVVV